MCTTCFFSRTFGHDEGDVVGSFDQVEQTRQKPHDVLLVGVVAELHQVIHDPQHLHVVIECI